MTNQFTKVRAIFQPANEHIHTLRDEYKQFIGKEFMFQYSWIMEEDEMFPGVWALVPLPDNNEFVASWVPEFDLIIVELVS
jgi:hypothetical protein